MSPFDFAVQVGEQLKRGELKHCLKRTGVVKALAFCGQCNRPLLHCKCKREATT